MDWNLRWLQQRFILDCDWGLVVTIRVRSLEILFLGQVLEHHLLALGQLEDHWDSFAFDFIEIDSSEYLMLVQIV